MGALSYADVITIICPSIRDLNKILKKSKEFICIQFGDKHIRSEKAFVNSECLSCTDIIRH